MRNNVALHTLWSTVSNYLQAGTPHHDTDRRSSDVWKSRPNGTIPSFLCTTHICPPEEVILGIRSPRVIAHHRPCQLGEEYSLNSQSTRRLGLKAVTDQVSLGRGLRGSSRWLHLLRSRTPVVPARVSHPMIADGSLNVLTYIGAVCLWPRSITQLL